MLQLLHLFYICSFFSFLILFCLTLGGEEGRKGERVREEEGRRNKVFIIKYKMKYNVLLHIKMITLRKRP